MMLLVMIIMIEMTMMMMMIIIIIIIIIIILIIIIIIITVQHHHRCARGVSRKTLDSIKELVGVRADKILLDMQKAVISSTLNIARSFKVLTAQDL